MFPLWQPLWHDHNWLQNKLRKTHFAPRKNTPGRDYEAEKAILRARDKQIEAENINDHGLMCTCAECKEQNLQVDSI